MASDSSTSAISATTMNPPGEEESILSFLTSDFIETQTTNPSTFDASPLFDPESALRYSDLLHPPSPPTSVGTYSESSGSPQHCMDSGDEAGSDVQMDASPLEYWQYVYPDLTQPTTASLPLPAGTWPLLPGVDASLLQPIAPALAPGALFGSNVLAANLSTNLSHSPNGRVNISIASPAAIAPAPSVSVATAPPSPATSVKAEKKTKRAKKQLAPAPPVAFPTLAPLKPLAPQPTPPSPPISVHDAFIKQSPPLSPRILPAPSSGVAAAVGSATSVNTATAANTTNAALRRPSIVPAPTSDTSRSNSILVKSTMALEEKPQSEAAMSAQAKRQERLIKNRAAALLSRKRKREHISLLESHTDILKTTNQDLTERVAELEENVKVLTEERDAARQECEQLHHQILVLTHRPLGNGSSNNRSGSNNNNSSSSGFGGAGSHLLGPHHHPDTILDLELNCHSRSVENDRGLNSKATGVVFMIILFSFALFNLPSGKFERLMVGGSLDRPRIGSNIIGRALNSYTKNPTISGRVESSPPVDQDFNNMTDLVVFSDNRALQTWLGHQPVKSDEKTDSIEVVGSSIRSNSASRQEPIIKQSLPGSMTPEESTKSVGFHWKRPVEPAPEMNEPDRDAWLYCTNLLYSLRQSSVLTNEGPSQATNGEIRRPRLSLLSPLDGVMDSMNPSATSASEKNQLPPWMPKSNPTDEDLGQKYLRLDVEVTSSRVVSGKGLSSHEQVIQFPMMPVGVFENVTTSVGLEPSKAAAAAQPDSTATIPRMNRRRTLQARNRRVNDQGNIVKTRRVYETKDPFFKMAEAASRMRRDSSPDKSDIHSNNPLTSIKEEPMEIFIKDEPMD
ncbi:hypothetical protein BGW38_005147 [Lunasporangiospora selenospora]|uniref:BZIP domain-containing protein n=1 Tax=Lunasporangiospora selenospora TaxID=979761 RepID=A0A9P6FND0_9FUNG|nr:hypothetical protein BGW38_005147 [Lunasporangiospora selenospora]